VHLVLPPFLYGPLAPGYEVAKGDVGSLSTNGFILSIIHGAGGRPMPQLVNSLYIDVREAALAHVRALKTPPSTEVGRKRLLISGGRFVWPEVVEYLAKARPQIAGSLPDPSTGNTNAREVTMDTTRAKELLGFDSYKDWRPLMEEAVDSLLGMLSTWA
jgi:nucleoside-diphosphate-sugar epimerase